MKYVQKNLGLLLLYLPAILILAATWFGQAQAKVQQPGCAEFATVYAVHISICHDDQGHTFAVDNYGMITSLGD